MIKNIASLSPTLLLIHVNKTEACFSLCECPDRGTKGGKVLHDCQGHKSLFLLYHTAIHSQNHFTAQDGCFSCHHHHLNSNQEGEEKGTYILLLRTLLRNLVVLLPHIFLSKIQSYLSYNQGLKYLFFLEPMGPIKSPIILQKRGKGYQGTTSCYHTVSKPLNTGNKRH